MLNKKVLDKLYTELVKVYNDAEVANSIYNNDLLSDKDKIEYLRLMVDLNELLWQRN